MKRSPVTREEAMGIIEVLLGRRFDTPLPALSTGTLVYDWIDHLAALPLALTLSLQGRAMFAPTGLDATARRHAAVARAAFFTELGAAVGVSARVLHAAVQARRFPLEPPRPIAGYEYLGAFLSEGKLDVADPCYLRRSSGMPSGVFSLSYAVEALTGTWHVFVRNGSGVTADRTAELTVIHGRGFDVAATQQLTTIGVDAGVAGVFARNCPPVDTSELGLEGVVHGRGAYASSGYGDGAYPVFAGHSHGQIAKLRLAFFEDRRHSDATVLAGANQGDAGSADATVAARAGKRYAASETFAVGDTIAHPKFGTGRVSRVVGNKIDVDFDGELRTLIHGRR